MFKPLNKRIFVRPDKPLEKQGEIFVVTGDDGPPASHGIVEASDSEMCKPGDRIVYSRFWPTDVGEGADLVVVDEKDLCGVDINPTVSEAPSPTSKQVKSRPTLNGPDLVRPQRGLLH